MAQLKQNIFYILWVIVFFFTVWHSGKYLPRVYFLSHSLLYSLSSFIYVTIHYNILEYDSYCVVKYSKNTNLCETEGFSRVYQHNKDNIINTVKIAPIQF